MPTPLFPLQSVEISGPISDLDLLTVSFIILLADHTVVGNRRCIVIQWAEKFKKEGTAYWNSFNGSG